MTGAFEFAEVGPTGELTHGKVAEDTYTNKAGTYGRMFSVTRQDLVNDDLGALAALPKRIGRGGALKLNLVVWTVFMNNSAFFKTANKNYATGAGTVLSVAALTAAELLFLDQTDTDGKPLGLRPKTLLVPNALSALSAQLMKSLELRDTTASKKYVTANPHVGKFEPVPSSYLSNSSITGNSTKAWYMLADARDMAVVEVVFLNGVEVPTVQRADADFNTLGVQFRGFFDFGAALLEPRGGVKMRGE